MPTVISRALLGAAAAVVLTGLTGGIAGAATTDVPIWVLQDVDLGSVLGPTVPVPTQGLAPVDQLLAFLHG